MKGLFVFQTETPWRSSEEVASESPFFQKNLFGQDVRSMNRKVMAKRGLFLHVTSSRNNRYPLGGLAVTHQTLKNEKAARGKVNILRIQYYFIAELILNSKFEIMEYLFAKIADLKLPESVTPDYVVLPCADEPRYSIKDDEMEYLKKPYADEDGLPLHWYLIRRADFEEMRQR